MKYYLERDDLYIEITASVFNQIRLQAEGEYPNENGGMLAGRYSADRHTVYIENIVEPKEKLTSRTTFMRNTKGHETVWNVFCPYSYLSGICPADKGCKYDPHEYQQPDNAERVCCHSGDRYVALCTYR